MMVDRCVPRSVRALLLLATLLLIGLLVRVDVSAGSVAGQPTQFVQFDIAFAPRTAAQAHLNAVRARRAEIRATKRVRARCLRQAKTAAQARPCRSQKVSLAVRRLATQTVHREVVCHRGVGHGTDNWVAIPPDQSSRHIGDPDHPFDFIIFAEYPDGAKWSDLKAALDTKCDEAAPRPRIEPIPPATSDVCETTNDTYTIPSQEGIYYTVNGTKTAAGTYPGTGTVTILAVAVNPRTVLAGPATWTVTFTNVPCQPVGHVPPAPSVTPVCGPDNDQVTLPHSYKFTYTSTGWSNNSLTVTATPKPGVVVKDGATTQWTFTDMAVKCDSEGGYGKTPPPPSMTPVCGPHNDIVNLPSSEYFTYSTSQWSDGLIVLTATPKPGVKVADDAELEWTYRDFNEACPPEPVAPPAPAVDPVCGPNNDVVSLPDSDKFTYTSTGWSNNSLTVTATPKLGVVVKDGAITEWTFTDQAEQCSSPPVYAPKPTVAPKCGPNNDLVTLPDSSSFTYSSSGWSDGTLTVTATPKDGVNVAEGAKLQWSFTDKNEPCVVVATPPAPSVTPVCGPDNDSVTLPESSKFTYTSSGWSQGTLVVRASPKSGVVVKEGAATKWTYTDSAEECPSEPVEAPRPAVSPVCGPNNDVVRAPANAPAGVNYTIGAWSGNRLTVTVGADDGVELTGATSWTFTDAATPCPTVLGISKSGPGSATAKSNVRYTIVVRNRGRATAYNVVIRDFVPSGMVLVSVPSGGTMAGGAATWSVGTLAPGASRTVTVTMRSARNVALTKCNVARGSASNAPSVSDSACTRFVRVAGRTTPGVTG